MNCRFKYRVRNSLDAKQQEREKLTLNLKSELDKAVHDPKKINEIREKIREIDIKTAEKIFVTAHMKYLEEGEKPTKFFFNLQKTREKRSALTKITQKDTNGNVTSQTEDQREIMEHAATFYENLYTADKNLDGHEQTKLLQNITRKLTTRQRQNLERNFTKQEIKRALFQTEDGKSPGWDGLPYEFYKYFWNLLENPFFEMHEWVLNHMGRLTDTQRKSLINYGKNFSE